MIVIYIVLAILVILTIIAFSYSYAESAKVLYSRIPFVSEQARNKRCVEYLKNKINLLKLDNIVKEGSIKRIEAEILINEEKIQSYKEELEQTKGNNTERSKK